MKYRSSNKKVATVDKHGKVVVHGTGKATITISARANKYYKKASRKVTIYVSLARPELKAVNLRSRKIKITWSKVKEADGYRIYIKGPGDKHYRYRLTKSARVKSVTHKGLVKGGTYRYKVVAFMKSGVKRKYSPYSAVRIVTVRK